MINKNQCKTAVASVIFPSNLQFFEEFLESLSNQTEKNFELVLCNDGCNCIDLEKHLDNRKDFSYQIVNTTRETPSEIRVELIEYIKSQNYQIIVFADTDDFFSKNRIELSIREIEKGADVVINDLSVVTKKGELIRDQIWGERIKGLDLDLDFLMKQNILGLGNTSINVKQARFKIQILKNSGVFDWIFYLQFFAHLKNPKCAVIDAITFYRQHDLNTLGLKKKLTADKLKRLCDIKDNIYSFAKKLDLPNIEIYLLTWENFKRKVLGDHQRLNEHIEQLNKTENLFWFEETNLPNERNTT